MAVVVTHNRVDDLARCLEAVAAQTEPPDRILVVDNASDAATREFVSALDEVECLRLETNVGGAGGFAAGLEWALSEGCDWVWVMDDDSLPAPSALAEALLAASNDPEGTCGFVIPTVLYGDDETAVSGYVDWDTPVGPDEAEDGDVEWGPFLGLLLRADACRDVGPIRRDFFIWGDDAEYCLRLLRSGWRAIAAPRSQLRHPAYPTRERRVLGRNLVILVGPPWKEYYGARNIATIREDVRGTAFEFPSTRNEEIRTQARLLLADHRSLPRVLMRMLGLLHARRNKFGMRVAPGALGTGEALRMLLRETVPRPFTRTRRAQHTP